MNDVKITPLGAVKYEIAEPLTLEERVEQLAGKVDSCLQRLDALETSQRVSAQNERDALLMRVRGLERSHLIGKGR